MMAKPDVTECFLIRGDGPAQVMLGRKKRGVGEGKLVGVGGKVEPGETPAQAAIRELNEEVRVAVDPADLEARGVIEFRFPFKPAWSMTAHIYVAPRWRGEPTETDEIAPAWFDVDGIPFGEMWPDAAHWLTGVLRGGHAHVEFEYGADNETIVRVN